MNFVKRSTIAIHEKEFSHQLAEKISVEPAKATEFLEAFKELLTESLLNKKRVVLANFGTFDTHSIKEREIFNSKIQNEAILAGETTSVTFRSSYALKCRMKNRIKRTYPDKRNKINQKELQ
jgi:nucleoid DNA-binding protein